VEYSARSIDELESNRSYGIQIAREEVGSTDQSDMGAESTDVMSPASDGFIDDYISINTNRWRDL
jgi:hypothetical protein